MSVTLERKQVIELLDKLGSDQDEDALAAARMLHKQISGSGMSWDDLLVGDGPEVEKLNFDTPDMEQLLPDHSRNFLLTIRRLKSKIFE